MPRTYIHHNQNSGPGFGLEPGIFYRLGLVSGFFYRLGLVSGFFTALDLFLDFFTAFDLFPEFSWRPLGPSWGLAGLPATGRIRFGRVAAILGPF